MIDPAQFAHAILAAAAGSSQQRINDVAERFRGGGTDITATHVVVFLVVVAVLGLVLWRVTRVIALREGRSYFSPKRLFRELCQLHELDRPSCRLVRQLAQARGLEHPAQLFLEPAAFAAAEIPPALQPYRTQLADIRRRLFEGDAT